MTNAVIQLPKGNQPAAPIAPVAPGHPDEPVPQAPVITVATTAPAAAHWQPPIFGSLAVIFGVAALFTGTLVLAPLGRRLALELSACLRSRGAPCLFAAASV